MAGPVYFQWQNQFLLETIYTSRERKLTDFLVYYQEVDLWKKYKDEKIENLQSDVQQYIADREKTTREAYQSYKDLYNYFLRGDVRAKYGAKYSITDEKDLDKLKMLHKNFADNLPRIGDVRKEKYFVTRMYVDWEAYLKKLTDDINYRKRRLASMVNQAQKLIETQELQKIENILLRMANDELSELRLFLSSYNKIEKRKLDLSKAKDAARLGISGARARLDGLNTQLRSAEAKQRELANDIARLDAPPSIASVQGRFTAPDAPGHTRTGTSNADPVILNTINGLRRKLANDLRSLKDEAVRQVTIKNLLYPLQEQQTRVNKEITQIENESRMKPNDPKRGERQMRLDTLRETQRVLDEEIDKVREYQSAVDYARKTPVELAQLKQAKEKELLLARQRYSQLGKDTAALDAQVKSFQSTLDRSEEDYLVRYTPDQPIKVQDIVRTQVDVYAASLAGKNQYELLKLIVKRFTDEPERYPLWLQYMVIHFSGMRYASAHGSWADPRDLLSSLLTPKLEKRFKTYDDNNIEALCQGRVMLYASPAAAGLDAPKFVRAPDAKSREKINQHLVRLKSPLPHQRRKALYDLMLDEQEYEIEVMKSEDVMANIREIGAQDNFPEWMWKEITRLTELRIQEVNSKDWEKLTAAEQEQRNDAKYGEYRALMNKWKEQNLTGWREEHDKSNRLIVTRSVCNEVAEQIQHLRGITPPGGLSAKPSWYMNQESTWKGTGVLQPYFRKPRQNSDYTVGASILWLRFVGERPNAWRIAQPLTAHGDGLIPADYLKKTSTEDWAYMMGNEVTRTRTKINEKKLSVKQTQWLRWIHEATVADVIETADGTYVLTFETALPYDDPRISTIGVFKRDIHDLLHYDGGEEYYNGSFVGFVPDDEIPVNDLEEMLDWNKILLEEFMTPAAMDEYRRQHIRKLS